MSLYTLQKNDLADFVKRVQADFCVVGPVETDHSYAFAEIDDPADLRLDYNTTILPPKKYFLPQRERLLSFEYQEAENGERSIAFQAEMDAPPTVIIGVHTCDMYGIQLTDKVFSEGFRDEHYMRRREQTYIIGLECLSPCDEHSFCKSMDTLSAPPVYDLHMTDIGAAYVIDTGTPKGEALLKRYSEAKLADKDAYTDLGNTIAAKWPRFQLKLKGHVSELPALMRMSYNSPVWEELAARCLECGSCTNVCPTCFCFDMVDETNIDMQSGHRDRVWDSCQLSGFARAAGGHNFRGGRAERIRHRFMRKAKYIPRVHTLRGCTGCGRCARACLADITMDGTLNQLFEERQAAGD